MIVHAYSIFLDLEKIQDIVWELGSVCKGKGNQDVYMIMVQRSLEFKKFVGRFY